MKEWTELVKWTSGKCRSHQDLPEYMVADAGGGLNKKIKAKQYLLSTRTIMPYDIQCQIYAGVLTCFYKNST